MPAYAVFAGGTVILLGAVLLLAILTQRQLEPAPGGARLGEDQLIATRELYLNVIASQLLVVGVLAGLVFVTGMPTEALGVGDVGLDHASALALGIVIGVALYVLDGLGVGVLDRLGIDYSEDLRGALAPNSVRGWIVLLVIVLPVIATAEELLFRAAIIGGFAAAFGISPWVLAVASSAVFAVGHGIQGAGGVLVTGTLGLLLAAAFILTGSLLVVVVAHYVVNGLEFVVNEGLGIDWIGRVSA